MKKAAKCGFFAVFYNFSIHFILFDILIKMKIIEKTPTLEGFSDIIYLMRIKLKNKTMDKLKSLF